jgi:putative salt-induced outer membrane protein
MPPPFFQGTEREVDARNIFMAALWHGATTARDTLGKWTPVAGGYTSCISLSFGRAFFSITERISMSIAAPARHSVLLRSVIGALLIGAQLLAGAQDLPQGFSGKGQVGYVMSRGNSDTDAANAKIDLFLLTPQWKHAFALEGLYGRSGEVTSAERWDLRLQSDYTINTKLFSFGALAYQDDRFSGFQYQVSASGGLGYKFFDSDSTKFSAQAGVGYRVLRPEILLKDEASGAVYGRVPLDHESEVVATGGIDFMHRFNSSTRLADKLIVESGSSNTSIKNDLVLEVKMSKKLALAAGYSVLHNTKPADDVKRTDTITTLNVVYAFPEPKK